MTVTLNSNANVTSSRQVDIKVAICWSLQVLKLQSLKTYHKNYEVLCYIS